MCIHRPKGRTLYQCESCCGAETTKSIQSKALARMHGLEIMYGIFIQLLAMLPILEHVRSNYTCLEVESLLHNKVRATQPPLQ